MRKHTSLRLVAVAAALGLSLAACGQDDASTTDAGTVDQVDDGSGAGPGMNMCAPGVPDCEDTAVDGAADCETADTDCDDTGSGDERLMAPNITIVEQFVDPATSMVETAPGSVAEPFRVFLQEAIVDGDMVSVSFSGGEAPCFVVDHVEVAEDDLRVAVSVWVGQPDPDADCSGQGTSMQAVTVQLAQPLGERELLDASRTAHDPNSTY